MSGVFKAYDIRGIWNKGISGDFAYKVGRAFGRYHGGKTYVLGYDARLHSGELYREVVRGLVDEGKEVLGIGLCSTPALHYAQYDGKFHGGLMVTASHNPPQYHGFKLFDDKGGSVSYAKGLNEIEAMVASLSSDGVIPGGSFREDDAPVAGYIDFLSQFARYPEYNLKIVIDPSNGSSGRIFKELVGRLNLNGIIINEKPDGHFPNHGPNPLEEGSRAQISETIKKEKADFGAILDGDGDRVLFVDEKGEIIQNYFVSSLISENFLSEEEGASIVYDLISSRVLPERIRELKGNPVISKVGYTHLYDAMVQSGALFGAETSGHVYFRVTDTYYTESAAYAVIMLLNILKKAGAPLSRLIGPLKERYYQAPEINLEVEDKEGAMKRVESIFTDAEITHLDGISIDTPGFWFNLRPSNTEPLLRLRLEAKNRDEADKALRKIMKGISG
ncbi:MAG: phosphomannomutase/phosphoglucomutase [Spirochaetales bacterium]|nr:phosphomannomutase/phosphoglucomutase [Spirochaetales bacterium]